MRIKTIRTYQQWMDEYSLSHNHPLNQKLHKICVPTILQSVIGFFWSLPTPDFFGFLPFLNWGTLFVSACLAFYLNLNPLMAFGMLIQTVVMCLICHYLSQIEYLLSFCSVLFILAWVGQFYGHKIEGKRPSFINDLAFLLIGPLWVTRFFFKKMGINV
jgi:uncharacterized membrane protein YGL010W